MDKIGERPKEDNVTHAKMDNFEAKSKSKDCGIHANKLPPEIVGRFLQNLSVEDSLNSESVSPRWKWALEKFGWTEQRKLDANIVFEGASEGEIAQFWETLDDGSCHLVSLLKQCSPWLRELNLHAFGRENIQRFLPQIAGSLESLKKLGKLDIGGLRLQDFVEHLPGTLRELKATDQGISIETFEQLSVRCPALEEVPFQKFPDRYGLKAEALIEVIGKFPRQKKLDLRYYFFRHTKTQGALASFGGQLKALEQLDLFGCECLDGKSFETIAEGCQRLRSLAFFAHYLTERELFQLARMPKLTAIEVLDEKGVFSDAVLRAIASRKQLKKFCIYGSNEAITDASVVYSIECCESLVSLSLYGYPGITERSVEAVVAEVRRRHGWLPRTLPSGPLDPGVFYFQATGINGINNSRARELIGNEGNPWLRFDEDRRKII